jgi:hypothetical protein
MALAPRAGRSSGRLSPTSSTVVWPCWPQTPADCAESAGEVGVAVGGCVGVGVGVDVAASGIVDVTVGGTLTDVAVGVAWHAAMVTSTAAAVATTTMVGMARLETLIGTSPFLLRQLPARRRRAPGVARSSPARAEVTSPHRWRKQSTHANREVMSTNQL